jgi:hypothetical protein
LPEAAGALRGKRCRITAALYKDYCGEFRRDTFVLEDRRDQWPPLL